VGGSGSLLDVPGSGAGVVGAAWTGEGAVAPGPVASAAAALSGHKLDCVACLMAVPCAERVRLTAAWRRALREHGTPGPAKEGMSVNEIQVGPEPTVTCDKCGRRAVVQPYVRGFPPDVARNKLRKACRSAGCDGEPQYRAGVQL
jgi:hypothetical protein